MPVPAPQRIAHMQPTSVLRALRLQNHLVELAMVADKGRELLQLLLVGDEDVGSLAQRMLTARHAVNGEVQLWTAISTGNHHHAAMLAQGSRTHSQSSINREITMACCGVLSMPYLMAVPERKNSPRAKWGERSI